MFSSYLHMNIHKSASTIKHINNIHSFLTLVGCTTDLKIVILHKLLTEEQGPPDKYLVTNSYVSAMKIYHNISAFAFIMTSASKFRIFTFLMSIINTRPTNDVLSQSSL